MSDLRLLLLGSPRIEQDGAPVEIRRRKAIALCAYLAVTGEPHRRESLAALLWPDYDESRPLPICDAPSGRLKRPWVTNGSQPSETALDWSEMKNFGLM